MGPLNMLSAVPGLVPVCRNIPFELDYIQIQCKNKTYLTGEDKLFYGIINPSNATKEGREEFISKRHPKMSCMINRDISKNHDYNNIYHICDREFNWK